MPFGLIPHALGFAKNFIPSSAFGVGYTGGAYAGYGIFNTLDPLNIHGKPYKQPVSIEYKMPYGSYGRRRYNRSRYSRYSGRTRYSRYRKRRYYTRSYRRRSYY